MLFFDRFVVVQTILMGVLLQLLVQTGWFREFLNQTLFVSDGDVEWLHFVGVFLFSAVLYVAAYAGNAIGHRWFFAIIPPSTIFFGMALLQFIDSGAQKQFFTVFMLAIYYMTLLGIIRMRDNLFDLVARGLFSASIIASLFFFYALTYRLYLDFSVPLWILVCLHGAWTALMAYVSFFAIAPTHIIAGLYAVGIGYVMAQISWVANFWPFQYLTTAAISLTIYYVLWDLAQTFFLDVLSKYRVLLNMSVCCVIIAVVLLTSQWVLVS